MPPISPIHVAIIMDGNGRWATQRQLPRQEGHRAGAQAVRRTVEAAIRYGLHTLTLYAFSADNWKRPQIEVNTLMLLFRSYLTEEVGACARQGIRLSVIGRRDRLPRSLVSLIEQAELKTARGQRLHLRLAVDYSSRYAILEAARAASNEEEFRRALGPDVDLLIRTAGEQRLSDFLLWECAYAEFVFLPQLWPDFDEAGLRESLRQFWSRERRFGGLPAASARQGGEPGSTVLRGARSCA
ncbi:MAG: polyprenyl diphosphate synthase [Bryobacteraceae bacterium]|nr:polyprenyl diphosphate synthase [Bryobacteraceae bacterium]MDW8379785.1 polyprenyl diphosphate synthase [Bryobacterales bacterium]